MRGEERGAEAFFYREREKRIAVGHLLRATRTQENKAISGLSSRFATLHSHNGNRRDVTCRESIVGLPASQVVFDEISEVPSNERGRLDVEFKSRMRLAADQSVDDANADVSIETEALIPERSVQQVTLRTNKQAG